MPKKDELSLSVNNSSAQSPLFANEIAILTKESNEVTIKSYFEKILKISQLINDYPVSLDEVWPLVYKERCIAVRALKTNFIEGIDFCLTKKSSKKEGSGGHNKEFYMLSIPCLEYFIARKVRPVFEVYRKVFHKVVTGRKEVIYTESEIKRHLTQANKAVKEATERAEQETQLRQLAESQAKRLKSQVDTLQDLYSMEVSTKINMLSFINEKGLKKEWDTKYGMFL